eukprot:COSAG01_NODE_473_length_16542_cov_42.403651_17_plen_38_part_00
MKKWLLERDESGAARICMWPAFFCSFVVSWGRLWLTD